MEVGVGEMEMNKSTRSLELFSRKSDEGEMSNEDEPRTWTDGFKLRKSSQYNRKRPDSCGVNDNIERMK